MLWLSDHDLVAFAVTFCISIDIYSLFDLRTLTVSIIVS